jgi:hypothetical protein
MEPDLTFSVDFLGYRTKSISGGQYLSRSHFHYVGFRHSVHADMNRPTVFWTKIIMEHEIRHSKWRRKGGKGKGGTRRLMRCRFSSLPVPRLAGQQRVYL